KTIVKAAGHEVLFLPTYSPDLNDIEHDFALLKRARMYADSEKTLDDIVRDYCS
ncbi:MAG: IS630 family transposase, partial [Synechococcaceae cyanobacterium SM2_3_2]|nr:IS630 family transposase [Synechococcaceae cyanobacterium SM2_3_2]